MGGSRFLSTFYFLPNGRDLFLAETQPYANRIPYKCPQGRSAAELCRNRVGMEAQASASDGSFLPGGAFVAQAVAAAFEGDDFCALEQSVEDGPGGGNVAD